MADAESRGEVYVRRQFLKVENIAHGPDGAFYLGLTDPHIFARREGLRDTEWERPGELYNWGNNRALVLMKSYDLLNWTHSIYHVGEEFGEFRDVGCLWAPQMIYDEAARKMLVSFTTRFGKGRNKVYFAYADDAFTRFETEPEELLAYPRDRNIIDSDIMRVGDSYHLFYVAHDNPGGIRHAVSPRINGGYVFDDAKVDPEQVACEAPRLWRRLGTETYVLMYDVFGVSPHNFGFSETTDFKEFRPISRFNEGVMKTTNFSSPKYGAIVHLTQADADRLAERWQLEDYRRASRASLPRSCHALRPVLSYDLWAFLPCAAISAFDPGVGARGTEASVRRLLVCLL